MLSTRLVDTSSNCTILKKSLLEDLVSYSVINNGDQIRYNKPGQPLDVSVTYKLSSLSSYLPPNIQDDIWYPIIINDDVNIQNKKVSDHGAIYNGNPAITSGRIGIENFISFTPSFNSFSVSAGVMSIDWILNRAETPHSVYYGIPCWIRKIGDNNPFVIKSVSSGSGSVLERFPNGSRLYHSTRPNDILIKINDNQLYVTNKNRYNINVSPKIWEDENTFIIDSSSLTPNSYKLADKAAVEIAKDNTTIDEHAGLDISGVKYNLWIPDGDCFSYFTSESEKILSVSKGIPSSSYISPALYKYYRAISRILTLDEIRSFKFKNLRRSRCYRKLAHALSTSPFISDMSIEALDISDIRNLVSSYISQMESSRDLDTEIALFKTVLGLISSVLQKTVTINSGTQNSSLYLDTRSCPYSVNNNYITNKKTLFQKLIDKYGAAFVSSTKTEITATNIPNNEGIVITQAADYYCSKSTSNTKIISNQTIRYDNTKIITKIDNFKSEMLITDQNDKELKNIPLYEIGKPSPKGDTSYFHPRITASGYLDAQRRIDGVIWNPQSSPDSPADIFNNLYGMGTDSKSEAFDSINPNPSPSPPTPGDPNALPGEEEPSSPGMITTNNGITIKKTLVAGGDHGPELDAINLMTNEYYYDGGQGNWQDRYLESQIGFYWTFIDGPSSGLEFVELNGGYLPGTRPSNTVASSRMVRLKVSESGKYVIQCQINTPYGTFKKQKTIYIYDAAELIVEEYGIQGTSNRFTRWIPNPNINKWYNHDVQEWQDISTIIPPVHENTTIRLNKDKIDVSCPKFKRIAISNKAGVVSTIDTNISVVAFGGQGATGGADLVIEDLQENYKFSYAPQYRQANSAQLIITYENTGVTIKIYAIYLENIRSNKAGCEQCYSMYEPKLISTKSSVATGGGRSTVNRLSRANKNPEGFAIYRFTNPLGILSYSSVVRDGTTYNGFDYPVISTKNSPRIKTYGGYSNGLISTLGLNSNIEGLPKPIVSTRDSLFEAANPSILPSVTGFPLNYRVSDSGSPLLCYQKAIPYTGGGPIAFYKGVLHPFSGWLPNGTPEYNAHANTSSVLKFNPGARKTFTFIGPKMRLDHPNSDVANNRINISRHKSSIRLELGQDVRWDPPCYCNPKPDEYDTRLYNENQMNKEYIDTTTNISDHAYRYLYGGQPKSIETTALRDQPTVIDEFGTEQKDGTFKYYFPSSGPAVLASQVGPDSEGKVKIRIPRINSSVIHEIEVKLNFLNYVNTKNIIVYLDSNVGITTPAATNNSELYPAGIISGNNFLDQTIDSKLQVQPPTTGALATQDPGVSAPTGWSGGSSYNLPIPNNLIKEYVNELVLTLPDIQARGQRLLLLNQEQIANNTYHYSLHFSDRAPKYNSLYNYNIFESYPNSVSGTTYNIPTNNSILALSNQNIIRNNDYITPTLAANNYSDRQACKYISIFKHNRLNITARSFDKFKNLSLWSDGLQGAPACPAPGGAYPKQRTGTENKDTVFSLNIVILDEPDDMEINDLVINSQYLANIESSDKKQQGTDIIGSLCNWELILHIDPVQKFVPHTNPTLASYGNADSLALIDYDTEPNYPGYSFIADLTNYKHLLPLVNLDAPNGALSDTSLCLTDQNDPIGGGFVVDQKPFPTHAIIGIMASLFGGTTGTLIGTATAPGVGYNQGFNALIDWLKESSFMSTLQDVGRQVYMPSYNKYPFGSPEKILLNVKKPGSLWYSLEATIMKYHNTHILKQNKHEYIKVQRGSSKLISEFKFNIVSDYTELLDVKNIKNISIDCSTDIANISLPMYTGGYVINPGDLVDLSFVRSNADTDASNTSPQSCPSGGLYVANTGNGLQWIENTDIGISLLSEATSYFRNNAGIYNGSCLFCNSLKTDISNNRVISLPGRIPYDIFNMNDTVECFSSTDREDFTGNNPNIIQRKIVNKSLLYKNSQLYSVFRLDQSIGSQDYISPLPESNIVFVFDANRTVDHSMSPDYSLWGNETNHVSTGPPSQHFSMHSVGSYGNGSPFVYKNILSNFYQYNKLKNISELLNNIENDKKHYNKITVFPETNGKYIQSNNFANTGGCYGFSYGIADLQNNIHKYNKTKNTTISTENIRQLDGDFSDLDVKLIEQTKLSTIEKDSPKSFMYITMPGASGVIPSGQGQLTIENDYYEYIPYKFLTKSNFDKVKDRLNLIEDDSVIDNLENLIGNPSSTNTIIASSNIKYITKHLNNLTEKDPIECENRNNTDKSGCHKIKLRNKLNKLYIEKNNLLSLLETQAVKYATATYYSDNNAELSVYGKIFKEDFDSITITPDNGNKVSIKKSNIIQLDRDYIRKPDLPTYDPEYIGETILPKIESRIKIESDQSISVDHVPVNSDHYWINIDPKQSCILDFASNPKVLVSTSYTCIRSVETLAGGGFFALPSDNNVCPDFHTKEQIPSSGVELFTTTNTSVGDGTKYVYTIPSGIVDENKAKYPNITWKEYIKERYFNINGDMSIDSRGFADPGTEITIKAEEKYLVPVPAYKQPGFEKESQNTDYSADTNVTPGQGVCLGGTNLGSPGGLGLISRATGSPVRVGYPTRVENIFNLDDVTQIEVQVKRIPRLLRGCDLLSTIYRYGRKSLFRPQSSSNPKIPFEADLIGIHGTINNSLYCWICLQKNGNQLEYAKLPPFFQLQNEMIFRSLFGSIDRIENRSNMMLSYFPWELIPYEYE